MWRRLLAGALLLLTAAGSSALTLGRAQGVALIGRPLNLSIRVDLDAGADAGDICASADVFFGDTRIDRSRVTITMEPAANGQGVARLRTSVSVDEPVVTVYMQAGCIQKLTRRYVLLSEQPGDAPEPSATRPVAESITAVPLPAAAGRPTAGARRAPVAAEAPAGSAPAAAPAARTPKSGARRTEPAGARPAGRARLRIDPIDLGPERTTSLRLSGELSVGTEATPAQRAEAAAFWKALNARPEEAIRDAQRMQALEGDLRGLRDAVGKNTAAVGELRSQLERARSQRYANPVVYALAALALLALALAVWAWRRRPLSRGDAGDWWRGAADEDGAVGMPTASRPLPASVAGLRTSPAPGSGHGDSSGNLLARMEPVSAPAPLEAAAAPPAPASADFRASGSELTEFANSGLGGMRAAKAEEVHDVQQQADFFISLGEHARAIDVLRSHINAHPGTSPVAWLDLLAIYHRLHRREDYEATRQEFEEVFNAAAPAFDAYLAQGQGTLETYPEALERITALWPSPKVLELIETAIFRNPGAQEEPFGLEAYRELLLLHSIAKELTGSSDDNLVEFSPSSGFSDFDSTQIQPLSASPSTWLPSAAPIDPGFPAIMAQGVDIDIGQLGPPEDFMQIIGSGPEPGQPSLAEALDFNLDFDELPTRAQRPPRE
jgi:hypothetical protein